MFYCLECIVEGIGCEVWLNDLPVCTRGLSHGSHYDCPVNQFLIDGINECCLVIAPETPEGDGERWHGPPSRECRLTIALKRYPFGAIVGGPDALEVFSLNWTVDNNGSSMWPRCHTTSFHVDGDFGTMAWQRAAQVDLNDTDTQTGVMGLLKELHRSLSKGDHDAWLDLHIDRLADYDRLYQGPPGSRAATARQELAYTRSHGLRLAPLIEESSAWRLCGEGRLIECRATDGYPNLREEAKDNGTVDSYPVLAGCLDGRWLALR